MSEPKFGYDEVPYSSFTFPQTRPDRLATLGAFFGMQPAPPEKCRVLELGCGDGTNLISFAYILPESSFTGIDLGQRHITDAKKTATELQLKNVEFHCEDLMNFSRDRFGEFDYIIAHGLFSWVPENVRTKILEIYSDCLAPHGVGHISFNAYPGCKTREMLWDMMKYYTAAVDDPMQKVAGGIQYLSFLNFAADQETPYQTLINSELSQYSQRTAENIFHDDLSSINQPFYFHEFVELLKPHGLQFLSEVGAFWSESKLRPEIAAKLEELGDDIVRREQYTDFIKGRPFRSTLICRDSIDLDRRPRPEVLRSFFIASQAEAVSPDSDVTSRGAEKFRVPDDEVADVENPLAKAALVVLRQRWSQAMEFDKLIEEASKLSGADVDTELEAALAELLELFKIGFINLHRFRSEFPLEVAERPMASRFVQWQIRRKCAHITALSGMNLAPTGDLMRLLLLLCDGSRDRAAIATEMAKHIEFAESERDERLEDLPAMIESRLEEYAKLGLFHR